MRCTIDQASALLVRSGIAELAQTSQCQVADLLALGIVVVAVILFSTRGGLEE